MNLNNVTISNMNLDDLYSIKDTLEVDFDDFWNFNVFESELQNPNSTYFVLRYETEIIGFAGILTVLDEAEITNIVIKKCYRNLGLSRILLNALLDFASSHKLTKIHLEVNSINSIAIHLYESFGFAQVGLRPNYYKNQSAILMSKFF